MERILGFAVAATIALSVTASAAAERVHIRGKVTAVSARQLTVQTTAGEDLPVMLGEKTKYLMVVKSSLQNIEKGSYIGVATKQAGSTPVALEVQLFPPAMKGVGEGHYGWDRIPDTTVSRGTTSSAMTNGSVAAISAPSQLPAVNSSMTNGSVTAAATRNGAEQLTVTYRDGEQTILVPASAPVVKFQPGSVARLAKGANVFVLATRDNGKAIANTVAIGADGLKPPM